MLAADSIPLTPELFCTVVSLLACGSVIGTVVYIITVMQYATIYNLYPCGSVKFIV